ncbi:carbohydrate sulfotransferase 14-like [Antedon mediterranea]|uniref:carbohydrate sulfotransferase 14-like n=1 Tax=Antedon mediterranea TaxID=105859 RepID=UPI003AF73C84
MKIKGDFLGILITSVVMVFLFWRSVPRSTVNSTKSVIPKAKSITVNEKQRDFLTRMRNIQYGRKQTIKEACRKYKNDIGDVDVFKKPPWNIAVNDEYRFIYCFTPKVASTSWKRILLVLNGFMNDTGDQPQYVVNRAGMSSFHYLDERSPKDIKYILDSYTKFMFTRNPFSRVLSAFRNKLAPDTNYSQSDVWRKKLGYYISTLYNKNNEPVVDKDTSYDLTFKDFVRFLIDENQTNHKHWENIHWGYQYDRCRPCEIKYDIIGNFETLQDDSKYIMKITGTSDVTSFPSSNGSNPTNSSSKTSLQSYFSGLPLEYVRSLYERFKIDFEMFGYKRPTLNIPYK